MTAEPGRTGEQGLLEIARFMEWTRTCSLVPFLKASPIFPGAFLKNRLQFKVSLFDYCLTVI